jgi:hypothetical protein
VASSCPSAAAAAASGGLDHRPSPTSSWAWRDDRKAANSLLAIVDEIAAAVARCQMYRLFMYLERILSSVVLLKKLAVPCLPISAKVPTDR